MVPNLSQKYFLYLDCQYDILELGAGTGKFTQYLLKNIPQVHEHVEKICKIQILGTISFVSIILH
jgi:SAM-dependent MidA family methyltransferase